MCTFANFFTPSRPKFPTILVRIEGHVRLSPLVTARYRSFDRSFVRLSPLVSPLVTARCPSPLVVRSGLGGSNHCGRGVDPATYRSAGIVAHGEESTQTAQRMPTTITADAGYWDTISLLDPAVSGIEMLVAPDSNRNHQAALYRPMLHAARKHFA
jgi:hypothetical protein